MDNLTDQLTVLFEQAGKAHHEAFAATNGTDDEWSSWYADYLLDKLPPLLNANLTKTELAESLTQLSKDHPLNAPATPWPRYYADFFVDHYA
jgi:hypothetical protein